MEIKEGFSIVLAVWNQLGYTKLAVEHILKNSSGPFELVVVDNGSGPDVGVYFDSLRGKIRIQYKRNDANLGPIKAINQGLGMARHRYIAAIHNDVVILEGGWLEKMRRCFESHPKVGLIGLAGRAEIYDNGCVNEDSLKHSLMNEDLNEPMTEDVARVAVVDGLCLVMRRELVEKTGGLDEGFGYMHCYDLDLSLKSIDAGYENVIVNVKAIHIGNGGRTRKVREYHELVKDDYGLLKKNCGILAARWKRILPLKVQG